MYLHRAHIHLAARRKATSSVQENRDGLMQSPTQLHLGYTTNLHDVFCIGLGVGIVPRDLAATGAKVDVVEINPKVVEVAQKYFDLDPSKLNIQIGDGRYFVNRGKKQYDAIVLDAFLGEQRRPRGNGSDNGDARRRRCGGRGRTGRPARRR